MDFICEEAFYFRDGFASCPFCDGFCPFFRSQSTRHAALFFPAFVWLIFRFVCYYLAYFLAYFSFCLLLFGLFLVVLSLLSTPYIFVSS